MRKLSFHRMVSRIALLAALLLATLPTLGRLATHAPPPTHAMAMQHHGHAMPATPEPGRHPLPPAHQHVEDCAYCAVLSGAIPTTVPACFAPVVFANQPSAPRIASMPLADRHGSGLGARGPPPAGA